VSPDAEVGSAAAMPRGTVRSVASIALATTSLRILPPAALPACRRDLAAGGLPSDPRRWVTCAVRSGLLARGSSLPAAFPGSRAPWHVASRSSLTVARQRRIHTGFPDTSGSIRCGMGRLQRGGAPRQRKRRRATCDDRAIRPHSGRIQTRVAQGRVERPRGFDSSTSSYHGRPITIAGRPCRGHGCQKPAPTLHSVGHLLSASAFGRVFEPIEAAA